MQTVHFKKLVAGGDSLQKALFKANTMSIIMKQVHSEKHLGMRFNFNEAKTILAAWVACVVT